MFSRVRTVALTMFAAIGLLLAVAAPAGAAIAPRPAATPIRARSVLIITLPATNWGDIRDSVTPNLTRLFRQSALADLATRSVLARTDAGTGYLALGAGTRSVGSSTTASLNLERGERIESSTAGQVFRRRTGRTIGSGIGALGWPSLRSKNAGLPFDSVLGQLGRSLEAAHVGRYVIANADELSVDPSVDQPVDHREAALGLMDANGRVPGTVSGILTDDATAPFGRRLDIPAVLSHFPSDFTTRRQVVLVEASDLARADGYRGYAFPKLRASQHTAAMHATDELVGRLLEHVDLRRDAVVVVAPYHSARARTLTVAAVHSPGITPGLMESSTTRRAGFVQIVDVAPTILHLLGVDRPSSMEGREARVSTAASPYQDRLDTLIRLDRGSQFRDATIGKTTATLVTVTIVLVVFSIFGFGYYRRAWFRILLRWGSLAFLGYVTATFVMGAFPAYEWGTATYFVLVVVIALAFAAIAIGFGRARLVDPTLIALGMIVVLHTVDLLTGAHLQLNTVFGYSPTVGIRLAGIGNNASAQLCASALLFAVLLPDRAPRRGPAIGYGVLIVTFVVVGAPMFGQDFGGALSLGPTIALWWLLQSGRRVRLRTMLILVGVLVGAGLVAGFADLARPADERTHVGRLFEKIGSDGFGSFFTVVGRKAGLMFHTFSNTALLFLVLSVVIALLLAWRRSDLFARGFRRFPTLRPGLVCFAVLVTLATVLNDSGVQVTAMMSATLLPVLIVIAVGMDAERDAGDDATSDRAGPTPARAPVGARSPA